MDKSTVKQKVIKSVHRLTLADLFTFLRIVGSICLLFTHPSELSFFIIYTLCGASDILDGWIARATKTTSTFGARLDSIADLLFYVIMIFCIFPALLAELNVYIWAFVAVVVFMRIIIYVIVAIKFRCFSSMHTYLNKLSSAMIFFTPYFISTGWMPLYCILICVVGGLANIEELIIHFSSKKYDPSRKTIFLKLLLSSKIQR